MLIITIGTRKSYVLIADKNLKNMFPRPERIMYYVYRVTGRRRRRRRCI